MSSPSKQKKAVASLYANMLGALAAATNSGKPETIETVALCKSGIIVQHKGPPGSYEDALLSAAHYTRGRTCCKTVDNVHNAGCNGLRKPSACVCNYVIGTVLCKDCSVRVLMEAEREGRKIPVAKFP
jgi:hypothetical protein